MSGPTSNHSFHPDRILARADYDQLVKTALSVKEVGFARQAALNWLGAYPGDLAMRLVYAKTVRVVRGPAHALPILQELVDTDPQWLDAHWVRSVYMHEAGDQRWKEAAAAAVALGRPIEKNMILPKWGIYLLKARQCKEALKLDEAEVFLQRSILLDPPTPLAAAVHLEVTASMGRSTPRSLLSLAEHYANRWPKSIYGHIFHAHAMMESGQQGPAVDLLHRVVALDIVGQVPTRIWGAVHPYRSLWPDHLSLRLDMPLPARVAAALGRNMLSGPVEPDPKANLETAISNFPERPPSNQTIPARKSPELPAEASPKRDLPEPRLASSTPKDPAVPRADALEQAQAGLEKIAKELKNPKLAQMDGRFPVYLVFSTRRGLVRQYGQEGADQICREMLRLARSIRREGSWDALVLLGDEAAYAAPCGVKPAPANDPWALKLQISDLDAALKKSGKMIGSILIVGGPEIVPFHLLPNPVDDADLEVPSDNPYGTRDENYFMLEWAVGRLPGGTGSDPSPLLEALNRMTERRIDQLREKPWYRRILDLVQRFVFRPTAAARPSFGYTAAAWRKASIRVFRPIGEARSMLASPPAEAEHLAWNGLIPARLAYYNLHGLEDSAEWYGQRDPGQPVDGPDYPIALRPADVVNSGQAPRLVFSEACFGANIEGKEINEALALKFLQAGTQAVVGSTCTSYGSIATPLIAADFLGHSFWYFLQRGHSAGESLRLAKINLAEEMHRRQGYLDGEDQKTLISFVLYGDPLSVAGNRSFVSKSVLRPEVQDHPYPTICDRVQQKGLTGETPADVLDHVRQVVEQYLPGMSDARLLYSQENVDCTAEDHICPTSQLHAKIKPRAKPERRVVTLSKRVPKGPHEHPQYARLTLDRHGKVVKLAVSR